MSNSVVKEQGENRKNLWKKGQSGNPKGRPPNDTSFTEYAKFLFKEHPEHRDEIVRNTVEMAKKGDKDARKLLWAYIDGLPPQSIDLTSKGEKLGGAAEIIAAIEASKKK